MFYWSDVSPSLARAIMSKSCGLSYNKRDVICNCFLSALSWKGKGKWKSTFQSSDPSPSLLSPRSELLGRAEQGNLGVLCGKGSWGHPWHGAEPAQAHPTLPQRNSGVFNRGEKLFLALLLFVLLLVCVMFLLIKDGIFNICFLKKEAMIQVGTYFA